MLRKIVSFLIMVAGMGFLALAFIEKEKNITGVVAFGLVFIGVGFWLYKNGSHNTEEIEETDEELVKRVYTEERQKAIASGVKAATYDALMAKLEETGEVLVSTRLSIDIAKSRRKHK
jgi:hypothetical protein